MFLVPGLQLVVEFLNLYVCQCGQRGVSDIWLYPCLDFGAIPAERGGLEIAAVGGQPFIAVVFSCYSFFAVSNLDNKVDFYAVIGTLNYNIYIVSACFYPVRKGVTLTDILQGQ